MFDDGAQNTYIIVQIQMTATHEYFVTLLSKKMNNMINHLIFNGKIHSLSLPLMEDA